MIFLLRVLKARIEKAGHPSQPMPPNPSEMAAFKRRYNEIVEMGWQDNPLLEPPKKRTRGRPKKTKVQNLLTRLGEHKAEQLRFMTDWRVPIFNNQAERDLRMVKLQQKVSGSFRTAAGAKRFLAIRSYLSTAHKQGCSMLTVIQLDIGQAMERRLEAPTIAPFECPRLEGIVSLFRHALRGNQRQRRLFY